MLRLSLHRPYMLIAMLFCALGVSGCAPMIFAGAATGVVAASQERSVGDGFDDFTIQTDLEARMAAESGILSRQVNLKVVEGRVLLTGFVPDEEHRGRAGQLAWDSGLVREVINELLVGEPQQINGHFSDSWISTQYRFRLLGDGEVFDFNYGYDVLAGTIYLIGIARSEDEMMKAIDHARTINGVNQVVSHIILKTDPRRAS